ncbi:MAG: efflux RND transporter periplasmic adaptor subunit [Planctomycetes bacterium]|nr:efflux RND transporter periplasmic adaptor subunit [Planctomycetota bacterium]MCB9884272.1 efflux RND transporter periplasmic adaptor subunit [Planctomycetota bacterium]
MVKALRPWLLIPAAVLTVAAGIWYARRPQPVVVVVHAVAPGRVEATVANTRAGTVTANHRARLAPGQGGLVAELSVKEGDHVCKGQVLLQLWNHDLVAELTLARSQVEQAAASAAEAQLRADLADREAKRQRALLEQQIASVDRVDRAESEAAAAFAQLRAAQAAAAVRERQVAVAEAQLERTIVRAPFDGVVAEVNGEVGEFVTPSPVGIPTPPAIDLIDDGRPYVTAPIDEVDAAKVRVGMTAKITLDAFAGRSFAGKVRRIAPYVTDREKQARTTDVEVEFLELPEGAALLPGYSADVEVSLQVAEAVLFVPTEALRDGNRVLLLGADGVIEERRVTIGLSNWSVAEVVDGVAAGDRVITSLDRPGVAVGAEASVEPRGAAQERP